MFPEIRTRDTWVQNPHGQPLRHGGQCEFQIKNNQYNAKVIIVSLVTSLTYHIVTKVSVLFNLRISGCELRDNHCVSFTQLFKKKKTLYRHFSDFKSYCGFSIADAGYTIFPV